MMAAKRNEGIVERVTVKTIAEMANVSIGTCLLYTSDQCSSHNGIPPLYIIIIHRKQKIKRAICIMDKMRQINI